MQGCDTRGVNSILKDLLYFIDLDIRGENPGEVVSKSSEMVLDLPNILKFPYNVDSLRTEPVHKCLFHAHLMSIDRRETDQEKLSVLQCAYPSEFEKLDKDKTRRLLANCKANRVTVQGVLSVANMLALINERMDLHDLNNSDTVIECLNVAIIDMRYIFGKELDDVFKAVSSLAWMQRLERDHLDNMWKLANSVSERLKEMKEQREGLKWWAKSMNSVELPKLFSFCSSIGVVSLGEETLKRIAIEDFRFNLGVTREHFNLLNSTIENYTNVHAFTFRDKLTLVFGHSFPSLSIAWSKNFFNNILAIIEAYSDNAGLFSLESVAHKIKKFEHS